MADYEINPFPDNLIQTAAQTAVRVPVDYLHNATSRWACTQLKEPEIKPENTQHTKGCSLCQRLSKFQSTFLDFLSAAFYALGMYPEGFYEKKPESIPLPKNCQKEEKSISMPPLDPIIHPSFNDQFLDPYLFPEELLITDECKLLPVADAELLPMP